jgi:hypothetical protein
MTKIYQNLGIAITGIALSLAVIEDSPVQAASFSFSQGGWEYGGELLGSFTGDDLDNDGDIEANEVSALNVTFSGDMFAGYDESGEPGTLFFRISHSITVPSTDTTTLNLLDNFRYSFSTSQLSFISSQSACLGVSNNMCFEPRGSGSIIEVSDAGGRVHYRSFRGGVSELITTSSLAPVVTPLQQSVPEPSTVMATLVGGLGILLKRKKVLSPPIKETTKIS